MLRSADVWGLLTFSMSTNSPYSLYTKVVVGETKADPGPFWDDEDEPDGLFFRTFFELLRSGASDSTGTGGSFRLVTMISNRDGYAQRVISLGDLRSRSLQWATVRQRQKERIWEQKFVRASPSGASLNVPSPAHTVSPTIGPSQDTMPITSEAH